MAEEKDIEQEVVYENETEGLTVDQVGEDFLTNNLKYIIIGLVVVLGVVFGYKYWQSSTHEANVNSFVESELWRPVHHITDDNNKNFYAAIKGDSTGASGAFSGLEDAIDEIPSGTQGHMVAKYSLGVAYLNEGSYEDAIDVLQDVSFSDDYLSTVTIGAIGDAKMQLQDYAGAISQYEQAIGNSNNSLTTPIYLKKCGLAHEKIGEYAKAVDHYKRIKKEFPFSDAGTTIDKYIVKAESRI